ncbi:hypothetical protein Ahy_A04g018687 isoform B [Arachis hypogaea]|nr:hypothetical protein Ahy_A04g018687 isoform B [Arachis hypogaea]
MFGRERVRVESISVESFGALLAWRHHLPQLGVKRYQLLLCEPCRQQPYWMVEQVNHAQPQPDMHTQAPMLVQDHAFDLQKFVLQNLVVFPLKLQNLWLLNNYMGNCLDKDESTDTHSDQHVELASGNVKLISSSEAWEQKLEEATRDGKTVILNFSATWCGPCKMIAPYYCELSEKFTSIVFLIVDVDELSDFAATWDIKATPTFFFFQNGQQVDKLVGANKPELQKKIAAITDSVPKWQ